MAQKISKNFSRIGENIKKIRQAKKLSQADFANLFNLARPSVGAYEEGRSEPKIETLIQIAQHFRISIDVLLTRELSVSEIYSFDQLNKKLNQVHQTKSLKKSIGKEVLVVRLSHYLEYIVNLDKKDYLSTLEQITIPFSQNGVTRVFEMNGSEMEYQHHGIHHQDLVVCLKAEINQSLVGEVVACVHKNGIFIRRLKSVTESTITLSSDDPNYAKSTLQTTDILEFWKAVGIYTTKLSAPSRMEERILKIEEELRKMRG